MHAKERQETEKLSCRIYITDTLKGIAENTARTASTGTIMSKRWLDLITQDEQHEQPEDARTCQEIAKDIWKRIRGDK